jgi:hypothetical protein
MSTISFPITHTGRRLLGAVEQRFTPVHAAYNGYPEIPGYPIDTTCSGALGLGLRCVGTTDAYACQQGLVCFRWSPGYGACHPPEWIKTATISAAIPVQASTGCKADSGTGTPLLLTEKSWKGLKHSMCCAVLDGRCSFISLHVH